MIDPISRLIHNRTGHHGPVMLMYHSVAFGNNRPKWPWDISIQQFRNHLDFLVRHEYATPTMSQLVANPDRWTGRTAVITFDDGYANNLDAFNELYKRGINATWFVVSGSIGRKPDWPSDGRPDGRLLNAAELCEMQAAGMEIGSHSVSHVRLTGLEDDRLESELVDSKVRLENLLGNKVSSFAYPYGAWDARCAEAVKEAGYAAACTTRTGWALRDNNPFQIRRLTIFNTDTSSSLARKLRYASNDVSWSALTHHMLKQVKAKLGVHTP